MREVDFDKMSLKQLQEVKIRPYRGGKLSPEAIRDLEAWSKTVKRAHLKEFGTGVPPRLFHGTTKQMAHRILRVGLSTNPKYVAARNPSFGLEFSKEYVKDEGVAMTTDLEVASSYGTVVLEVNLPPTWPLQQGAGEWGEYQSLTDIPAKYIKLYKVQEHRVRTQR